MRIKQHDSYKGQDWWDWSVWIDCTPEELSTIDAVTWTLHPSFYPPVRKSTDRRTNFRLDESGWGTFKLFATAQFNNGSVQELQTNLRLHYPDTETAAPALIRFVNPSSDMMDHANSLQRAILEAAPNTGVTVVRVPPNEAHHESMPASGALSVDLTGPAVAALAKGIQSWLAVNSGVGLELVTRNGANIDSITSDNVITTLQSTMTALRDESAPVPRR